MAKDCFGDNGLTLSRKRIITLIYLTCLNAFAAPSGRATVQTSDPQLRWKQMTISTSPSSSLMRNCSESFLSRNISVYTRRLKCPLTPYYTIKISCTRWYTRNCINVNGTTDSLWFCMNIFSNFSWVSIVEPFLLFSWRVKRLEMIYRE